jgi:predicted nucleic acid binding AN1-type Zn finger protein
MQVGVYDRDDQMCQYEGCTEIDLLPARCSRCHKRFCSQHLSQSAHHCPAAVDVLVGTCPVCRRVVPLEYPRQNVDEAVSRHLDRGCRGVGQGGSAGSRNGGGRGASHSGHRLGGGPRACSVKGCEEKSETRVRCDQCGQVFCLQHRGTIQHDCRAAAARRASTSPSKRNNTADVLPPLGTRAASVVRLLTHPSNTPDKAAGKATELPSDMVTCLICFLIPTSCSKGTTLEESCEGFAPVPSFFMHTAKNLALGRVLDTAVDRAAMISPAVQTGKPWKLFTVTLPIHREAKSSLYPAVPLSTVVGKSSAGKAEHTILFLTPLATLPDCVVEAVKDLERKGTVWPESQSSSLSSGDRCRLM